MRPAQVFEFDKPSLEGSWRSLKWSCLPIIASFYSKFDGFWGPLRLFIILWVHRAQKVKNHWSRGSHWPGKYIHPIIRFTQGKSVEWERNWFCYLTHPHNLMKNEVLRETEKDALVYSFFSSVAMRHFYGHFCKMWLFLENHFLENLFGQNLK